MALTKTEQRIQKIKERAIAAIPASERVPARALCDIQWLLEGGSTDEQIAEHTKLPVEKVAAIIAGEGLRAIVSAEAEKSRDVKMRDRWVRAVALASRSLSLAGMEMADSAARAGDAFGFSLAARGAKTFVDMARQADGLDSKDGVLAAAPNVSLFFFCGDVVRVGEGDSKKKVAERTAEPISVAARIDVVKEDELGFV